MQISSDAAYAFAFGSILFQMLAIAYPHDHLFSQLNTTQDALAFQVGIGIAVAVLWAVINALRVDQQGYVNNLGAFWQIGVTVVVIAVLFTMGTPTQPASFV